jgi:hypothetical protein
MPKEYEDALSECVANYHKDLVSTGVSLTFAEAEVRFKVLSVAKPDNVGCELSDESPASYRGGYVWCTDHNMPATHVSTDGNTPVCVVHAQAFGCNCCVLNFNPKLRQRLLNEALPHGRFVPLIDRCGGIPRVVGLVEAYIDEEGLKIKGSITDRTMAKALKLNVTSFSLGIGLD